MKWLMYILLGLLLLFPVVSLDVPKEDDTRLIQNINQEHSNTRKFVSDELSRNRNEFFKEMDSRADYYEKAVDNMLQTAVIKLSLLWAGVVFFIIAFNNVLRMVLEKKRYKKLKESMKAEILTEMNMQNSQKMQQPITKPIFKSKKGFDVETDELFKQNNIMPPPPKPPKKTWLQNRKEVKQRKQYEEIKQKEEKLRKELGLDEPRKYLTTESQTPPQTPPKKTEISYKNNFEVEY